MAGFGAKAYQNVAVHSAVGSANPHQMILMLYDGAIEAIRIAECHLGTPRVGAKGQAIGKALRIIEEGLKACVDRKAGGELAERLVLLYDYITMRLLQANLRNDRAALEEARRLLGDLRSAWSQISERPTRVSAPPVVAARAYGSAGVQAGALRAPARIG